MNESRGKEKVDMETKRGVIKALIGAKRYGFIQQEDGTSIFFHQSGLIRPDFPDLREGMLVEYFTIVGIKEVRAIGVLSV